MARDVTPLRLRTSGIALAFVLLPGVASTQPVARDLDELVSRLRPGEMVWVTDRCGKEIKGEVIELSPSNLSLQADGHRRDSPADDIEQIRRRSKSAPNAVTKHMLDAAAFCDDISCLPAALTFVGIAALAEGIERLMDPPKTVYRAAEHSREAARRSACRQAAAEEANTMRAGAAQ